MAKRGKPPKDDSEAISAVQSTRLFNPKIGYREAARRYFRDHPEKLGSTKLESAARRVGDKAARADGRRPRRSDADALEDTAFRLSVMAREMDAMAQRLKGELPASGNRNTSEPLDLRTLIISMEVLLAEIRRTRFDE